LKYYGDDDLQRILNIVGLNSAISDRVEMSISFGRASFFCFCLILEACAKSPPQKLWTQVSGENALGHVQKLSILARARPVQTRSSEHALTSKNSSKLWLESDRATVPLTTRRAVRLLL